MAVKELYETTLFNDSNLVYYTRLESNSNDSKGSNNGTDTVITYGTTYGKFGQGGLFNGSTSKIALPDSATFKVTSNFTIGGWFKTSTTGTFQNIFSSFSQNTNTAGFYIQVYNDNKLAFNSAKNTGTTINTDFKVIRASTSVTDGNWHLAVGVWDGSNLRLYLDGNSDATAVAWANAPAYATNNYPVIGYQSNSGVSGGNSFNGSIDECFLFNRALSATEISNYYTGAYNSRFGGFFNFF